MANGAMGNSTVINGGLNYGSVNNDIMKNGSQIDGDSVWRKTQEE